MIESRFGKIIRQYKYGTIFFMPFLVLFLVFTVIPVFTAFYMSFTNFDLLQIPRFIGLENYKLLFMDDEVFQIAIKNTLILAVITGPIGYFGSFFMAWGINRLKFRNFFSLCFYAPSITSGIAMSVVWLYFFSPDRYGLVNNLLISTGLTNSPILWNSDSNTILPIIMLIQIWMSMGTGFLVFLAGLQNTDPQIYEAGRIDGIRSDFQELYLLTLPQMKPQLLFGAINACVGAFSIFDIAVGFAGMPSPNYAGHTLVSHLYDYAFLRFEMGYSSAIAVVLFLIVFVIGQALMKLLSSRND